MPVPVLTITQMREWEKATWATGRTEQEVIERVGAILARHILRLTRPGEKILILAGKGHNGDDARAAEKHLVDREVVVLNVADPKEAVTKFTPLADRRCKLIVDALFGIGINRLLSEDWRSLIETINGAGIPILSVDVPSGLNADEGEPHGAAVRATLTLCVGAPKKGLILTKAADYVGRLEVAGDVGLIPVEGALKDAKAISLAWTLPKDFEGFPLARTVATHKGSYGHVTMIAGTLGFHGAAVLAARGAMRAQPGLVSVITQENAYHPVASQLQAAMVHPWRNGQKLPDNTTALLFGPGLAAKDLSPALKNELRGFWNESPLPVIADASGLDWLPQGVVPRNPLRVITPHPGEAARLLKTSSAEVQADRVAALRELSRRYGNCWVVLKGHQTLLGRGDQNLLVNSSGNPYLAQGGSGDVLAGYLAGLLAQPALQNDVAKTIAFAVWQHGAAAERLSLRRKSWTVEELVEELGL